MCCSDTENSIHSVSAVYNRQTIESHGATMKLLIRNLARTITEAELLEMFKAHGTVQSCTLVMDAKTGISKGFGFVEMPKPGEAKAAMKNINGQDIAGSKIRVKKAEDKPADTGGDD